MNNTNDILTSLANLEQSLKDINSAKQQVAKVIGSSAELAGIIAQYKSSFEGISSNVKQILDKSKDLSLNILSDLSKHTVNLSNEIDKLSKIDLEKHFEKHQETLSKIFGAISSINLTLSGVTQHLTTINQSLGNIDTNQKAIHDVTVSTKTSVLNLLDEHHQTMLGEIKAVQDENIQTLAKIRKGIKVNRLIFISGMVFIITILWAILFKF